MPPNIPKIGNGLELLTRVGKSIWLKWVNAVGLGIEGQNWYGATASLHFL